MRDPGRRFVYVLLLATAAALVAASAQTEPAWKLVWADEFNTEGPPNPANWAFENGFVRNEELQWCQPQNLKRQKGYFKLDRTGVPCGRRYSPDAYANPI